MSPCAAIIIFPQNVTVVAACATVVVVAVHIVYLRIVVSRLKNEIKTLQGLEMQLEPPVIAVHAIYLQIDVSRLYKNNNKILQATCRCRFFEGDGHSYHLW